MSLPDTAEYWKDVDRHFRRRGSALDPYMHLRGLDCGHYHVVDTHDAKLVDCRTCRRLMRKDPGLLEQAAISLLQQNKRTAERQAAKEKLKREKYIDQQAARGITVPTCTCGALMVQRKRRLDGAPFWGCWNYPNCRGTKMLERSDE